MTAHLWKVTWERCVNKDLQKIPKDIRDNILKNIEVLARSENPLAVVGVKLVPYDYPGCHRQRVGKYRFVFSIHTGEDVEVDLDIGQKGVIHIVRVAHRKEIYN